jgi:SAM-dependent methyltransferase
MGTSFQDESIRFNIRAHDRVARKYQRLHGEIYNDIEQGRLRQSLAAALKQLATGNRPVTALDFGCGAGNLTAHLSTLGCDVIASDVSRGFLDLVGSRSYRTRVQPFHLNGRDLQGIADGSVDMVATYSVLHHLPDYLGIIGEFLRVLRKGGVLYLDHEQSEQFWREQEKRSAFEKEMRSSSRADFGKYLEPTNYLDFLIRKLINPRYRREGDLHVFPDDHIEWGKVGEVIAAHGGEIVTEQDYLLFKKQYDLCAYNRFRDDFSDMHLCVARKL